MKKRMLSILLAFLLCASCFSVAIRADAAADEFVPTIDALPKNGSAVSLLDGNILTCVEGYERYCTEAYCDGTDQYAPTPITLSWSCAEADYYTVKLAFDRALSAPAYYVTLDQSLLVEDLLMGKTYYYQILAHRGNETVKSRIFSFQTAYLTRTIEVEGISNTRDFGGYLTEDGTKRVRQGLLYRGGEAEGMTRAGLEKMLYTYGIRTDLDLRGYATSAFGKTVNFVSVSAPYYLGSNGILSASYKEALTTEIRTFADPANYPIYVHCALGRDRTGTLCFLINALCGVGEQELYMDYELSFLSVKGTTDQGRVRSMIDGSFTPLYQYLKEYPCDKAAPTLADRTEAFLKEYLGITQAEIDSIREILLEDADVSAPAPVQRVAPMMAMRSAQEEFMCNTAASASDGVYIRFGSTSLTRLGAEEAALAGIPAGFSGDVLVAENTQNTSIDFLMDFSDRRIPISLLESITFRVWVGDDGVSGDDYPELRILQKGKDSWVMRYDIYRKAEQWVDVTLKADGTNFESGKNFSHLSEDGKTLGKFGLMVRSPSVCVPFYVDSITYTLKENTTPPVIENRGGTTLFLHEGSPLLLNATAIDPEEGELALQYDWSDPAAINPDGTLNRGEHTLTVYATDYFGNRAEQVLTVKVGEADGEAPEIDVRTDAIRAVVGARPVLTPAVRDNSGFADVSCKWSAGALDVCGRLVAGMHRFSVVATDPSGNTTQKLISVTVLAGEDWGGTVIDEENPQPPSDPPVIDPPNQEENEGGNQGGNDQGNNDQGNNDQDGSDQDGSDQDGSDQESNAPTQNGQSTPNENGDPSAKPQNEAENADNSKLYAGIAIGALCGVLLTSLIFGLIIGSRKKNRD